MTVGSAPIARLGPVHIARFTTGDDPAYGVVSGDLDEYGQPGAVLEGVGLAVLVTVTTLGGGLGVSSSEQPVKALRTISPVMANPNLALMIDSPS
jgi:hypothetical protein